MKRWGLLTLMMICCLTWTACGGQKESPAEDPTKEGWGIALSAEDVTPTGMKLIITQSSGTSTGELQTGSYYSLEMRSGDDWMAVEMLPQEGAISWTAEAYLIPMGGTTELDISWEAFHGALSAGEYRLGKEIMDFRGPDDYDTQMHYVVFSLAE